MKLGFFRLALGLFSTVILFQHFDAAPFSSRDPVVNLCKSGQFALTFDQGPSSHTGHILDALAEHNVKATFHPVVTFLDEAAVVANLQRAADEGHLIGLSLEEGYEIEDVSPNDLLCAVNERAEVIKAVTGHKPVYLRIPKLKELTPEHLELLTKKGYIISTYNLDSYDYSTDDVLPKYKEVLDKLSPNTKGGFIAVQRDYIESSALATESVIQYVLDKGYNIVTLDECAKNKVKNAPGPNGLGKIKGRESGAFDVFAGSIFLAGLMPLLAGI